MAEKQHNPSANELRYPEDNVELHVASAREIEELFADTSVEEPVILFDASPNMLTPGIDRLTVSTHPYEPQSGFGMQIVLPRSIRMDIAVSADNNYSIEYLRGAVKTEMNRLYGKDGYLAPYGHYFGIGMDYIGRENWGSVDLLSQANTLSLRAYASTDGSESATLQNKQTLEHFYETSLIVTNALLHRSDKPLALIEKPTISIGVPGPEAFVETIPELPVTMDSLGGLGSAKERLREIKEVMEDPAMALEYGLEQKVALLLLHGKPGVGKTTLIKTFASEIGAQLISVKAVDIIDKWIGSSARNLMPHFQGAIEASKTGPVVLFFKEIDTMIAKDAGNSNEHTQLLGAFKSAIDEINDLSPEHRLIMLADTNADLDSLDAAMIRPGRFETVSCNLPTGSERYEIWQRIIATEEMKRLDREAATKARAPRDVPEVFDSSMIDRFDELSVDTNSAFSPDVDIAKLVDMTDELSGADFQGIITAIRRVKLRSAKGATALGPQTLINRTTKQITQGDLEWAISQFGKNK